MIVNLVGLKKAEIETTNYKQVKCEEDHAKII